MAQEWAKSFYTGKQWQKTQRAYMLSKCYVCERCGAVAEVVHHKKYLTAKNISDPNISLSFDNLEALCKDCHGKEHMLKHSLTYFDDAGQIERVKESGAIVDFKKQTQEIDNLLKDLLLEQGAIKSY